MQIITYNLETFFWFIVITNLKKYIIPLIKTNEGGTLHPPSDVYVRSFLYPFLYFNKTLLYKSSWVIKPGPWSRS